MLINNQHHSKNILFVLAYNQARSLNLSKGAIDDLAKTIGTHVRGVKETLKKKNDEV